MRAASRARGGRRRGGAHQLGRSSSAANSPPGGRAGPAGPSRPRTRRAPAAELRDPSASYSARASAGPPRTAPRSADRRSASRPGGLLGQRGQTGPGRRASAARFWAKTSLSESPSGAQDRGQRRKVDVGGSPRPMVAAEPSSSHSSGIRSRPPRCRPPTGPSPRPRRSHPPARRSARSRPRHARRPPAGLSASPAGRREACPSSCPAPGRRAAAARRLVRDRGTRLRTLQPPVLVIETLFMVTRTLYRILPTIDVLQGPRFQGVFNGAHVKLGLWLTGFRGGGAWRG